MKATKFLLVFAAATMTLTACDKYDDGELRDRIADLETTAAALNAQIKAGATIGSVTALADGAGWRIAFAGGTTPYIDILHGEDGANANADPVEDGRTPLLKVEKNPDGTTTVWVDCGDGNGWTNTGTDITGATGATGAAGSNATGIVRRITKNGNIVTIELTDGQTYTFRDATATVAAQYIQIMEIIGEGGGEYRVTFRVNPSNADVPTGDTAEYIAGWKVDLFRTTRASYEVTPAPFTLESITATAEGKTGEYEAMLTATALYNPNATYTLALVFGEGDALISSGGFTAMPFNVLDSVTDANFKAAIIALMTSNRWDTDSNGKLSKDEAAAVTTTMGLTGKNIASLKGIEHFTGLTILYCRENALTSFDVSALTNLTLLDCRNNALTSIDVSKNTALTTLYCTGNPGTETSEGSGVWEFAVAAWFNGYGNRPGGSTFSDSWSYDFGGSVGSKTVTAVYTDNTP